MPYDVGRQNGSNTKACFVAGGHMTEMPESITLLRDSLRHTWLAATANTKQFGHQSLHAMHVGTNADWSAQCREKVWFASGLEFDQDRTPWLVVIERALYGLISSQASWWHVFTLIIVEMMGFHLMMADPDKYRRANSKQRGFQHREYMLVDVYDVLLLYRNISREMRDNTSRILAVLDHWLGTSGRSVPSTFQPLRLRP